MEGNKMESNQLLKFCIENGLLLDKETFEGIGNGAENFEVAREFLLSLSSLNKGKIINRVFFESNAGKLSNLFYLHDKRKEVLERLFFKFGISPAEESRAGKTADKTPMEAREKPKSMEGISVLLHELPCKKIEVKDFTNHFRARYTALRDMLQNKNELQGLVSINRIGGGKQGISIIGIVADKQLTHNKNFVLNVEDLTGSIKVLVNQNKPDVYGAAKEVLLDDVIGIRCTGSRNVLFANEIIYPDASVPEKKRFSDDVRVVFTSDTHVGSALFFEENFKKFISWINGDLGDREEVSKIKYLFLLGDNVDGIGVYPGQENLLNIKDLKKQYDKLAELLGAIRKDITIIICPGQHDGVRVAEPQPVIGKDYGQALHGMPNVVLVTNPALVKLSDSKGVEMKVQMYHGASFSRIINNIEELRIKKAHQHPAIVAKHVLKRRHLAPTHSEAIYIPGEEDHLLIREVPDIMAIGDLHRPEVEMYNNILIISNSCWQAMTPFEEKVGNMPDPCKACMLNLKTREVKILDFN